MDENAEQKLPTKKEEREMLIQGTLDDSCLSTLKACAPYDYGKLNDVTINMVQSNLERGISMTSQCLYVGIPPTTAKRWFTKGQEEMENLTPEQIDQCGGDLESILSLEGKFYYKQCKQRANSVVELHNMLYERAFESGKEWLATYILERQEPEKYNLKFKVQQEVNANVNANIVEFRFVNGSTARPIDETAFINDQIEMLQNKYKNNDIIIDAEVTVISEKDSDEDV